ncbi:hypothetical protein ScPMuIL_001838 [Solemya velum]
MTRTVCRLCKKEYAFKGNTTNLQFHLDHDHRDLGSAVTSAVQKQQKLHNLANQPTIQGILQSTRSSALPVAIQKDIDNSLMKIMVGKVLPLSLVDSEYLKTFVSKLDSRYVVPSRNTLSSRLKRKQESMKQNLREDLRECRDISVTHDGWTSMSTESYQTTTAHFINKDWELKSVVLQTLKTEGTHTGEAIADHLEQMRKKWMPLVVPTAVTDNAANEKKAFDILKWHRFRCYGHRINLTVKKALQVNEVSRIVGKGRKLVTLFHQSSSLSDLLKAKQSLVLQGESIHHKLIQDVPTRWNSTYLMLS